MKSKREIESEIIDILIHKGSITRPYLNEYFDIRPATLLEIIDRLKKLGVIVEPERKSQKTGRKASPVCLNADYGYIAGIDFQSDTTSGIVIDMEKQVKACFETVPRPFKDFRVGKEEIIKVIESLKKQLGGAWSKVKGIGFTDPGIVDIERGICIKAVNIQGWNNVSIKKWITEQTGLDCIVYPSNMARAYIEHHNTFPNYPKSLFYIELDVGIGGGFMKNGSLFVGDTFCGMEIGHIVVDPNGPLCQCGNKGCLEAIAGKAGIAKKINELIANGVQTELRNEEFSIPFFVKCVKDNDKVSCALANEICNKIGIGLASAIALLNPSMIVFGGELSKLDEFLLSTVKRTISMHCFPDAIKNLQLKISKLDCYAEAMGAALIMRRNILENSIHSD